MASNEIKIGDPVFLKNFEYPDENDGIGMTVTAIDNNGVNKIAECSWVETDGNGKTNIKREHFNIEALIKA